MELAASTIRTWAERPDVMVRELFGATPDAWQDEVLQLFPHAPRIAMKACKGPGKTTVMAWLCWNFLLTRPFPNIAATSISGDNLRDNLWKEMAVWQAASPILRAAFEWSAQRISRRGPNANRWFMSARSWPKKANEQELGDTLAGLHSDFVMFVIDESGSIPPAILLSAEGALANLGPGKEAHILQAGNTTSLSGALYDSCVRHANLWQTVVITGDPDDAKRSPRVSLEWAKEMIQSYGRDNPFVKIMVLGEWPPGSVNALIGPDEVAEAQRRHYREYEIAGASKVMSVDVAREGDDASVLTKRQGMVVFPFRKWRNITGIVGAGAVAREWSEWEADACFIDMTGGFGSSWFDQLSLLGRAAIGVQWGGEAHNKARYANKRAEMYFDAVEWIRRGGALPQSPELLSQLPQITYTFQGDRLLLEPKKLIKARMQGQSPDEADSFVQTFAEPVKARNAAMPVRNNRDLVGNYDPYRAAFGG